MDSQNINPNDKMALEIEKHRQEAMDEMNQVLNTIFQKPLETLTLADKGFLQARRSYLTPGQMDTYKNVLAEDLTGEKTGLEELTRKELEAKATEMGIDHPEDLKTFPNKQSLIDLILQAQN